MIFSSQSTGKWSQKWNLKQPNMLLGCHLTAYSSVYSKVEDYETEKKTCWHQTQMKGNGGSLDFNSISLSSPMVDENWVSWHIIRCTIHLWKMLHTMFQSVQTFCNGKFTEHFHVPIILWHFPLFDACVHQVLLINFDITNTAYDYSGAPSLQS